MTWVWLTALAIAACGSDSRSGADGGGGYELCNGLDEDGDGRVDEGGEGFCTLAYAVDTVACVAGACAVGTCQAGFFDCNGQFVDGCEAALSTPATCGACDTQCTADQVCVGDGCVPFAARADISGAAGGRLAPLPGGGIAVAGSFITSVVIGGNEFGSMAPGTGNNGYLGVFDAAGSYSSAFTFGSPVNSIVNALAATPDGVYVTGSYKGSVALQGFSLTGDVDRDRAFVARVSSGGTASWLQVVAVPPPTLSFSAGNAVAAVGSDAIIGANYEELIALGGPTEVQIARYDPAGSMLWRSTLEASGARVARVLVDGSTIWSCGEFGGDFDHGSVSGNSGALGTNMWVAPWTTTGSVTEGAFTAGLDNWDDEPVAFVRIAGGGTVLAMQGQTSEFNGIVARTATGETGWELAMTNIVPVEVVSEGGTLWIGGYAYEPSASVGTTPLPGTLDSDDVVVVNVSEAGEVLRAIRFDTAGPELLYGMALDASGRLWLAFTGSGRSLVEVGPDLTLVVGALDLAALR